MVPEPGLRGAGEAIPGIPGSESAAPQAEAGQNKRNGGLRGETYWFIVAVGVERCVRWDAASLPWAESALAFGVVQSNEAIGEKAVGYGKATPPPRPKKTAKKPCVAFWYVNSGLRIQDVGFRPCSVSIWGLTAWVQVCLWLCFHNE